MKPPETDARSLARQAAFEALYSIMLGVEPDVALASARERSGADPERVEEIVHGVHGQRRDLQAEIERRLDPGWTLQRIANTDLLAILIGLWELRNAPDVPPKVSIVEAIELAKTFGVPESGRFVHGLLASYLADNPKSVAQGKPPTLEAEQEEQVELPEPEVPAPPADTLPWKIRRE